MITSSGQGVFDDSPRMLNGLRLLGILNTVALILVIVGGTNAGNAKKQTDLDNALLYRHIGSILFLVLYGLIVLVHGYLWTRIDSLLKHRRQVSSYCILLSIDAHPHPKLLIGISAVLPFLFVRVLYAVLSAFSPAAVLPNIPPHNSLSKFAPGTGSWQWYLAMSVIAELLTVITYLVVGASIRLQADGIEQAQGIHRGGGEGYRSDYELHPNGYYGQS